MLNFYDSKPKANISFKMALLEGILNLKLLHITEKVFLCTFVIWFKEGQFHKVVNKIFKIR